MKGVLSKSVWRTCALLVEDRRDGPEDLDAGPWLFWKSRHR